MTDIPPRGAFPHQHRDPRGLGERIQAQIRERLEEAVEMAGLKLMVDLRARQGRPAPDTSSDADRREFQAIAADLLAHLRQAFSADLAGAERVGLEAAEGGHQSERDRLLAGQVFLARRLPDYWQRLERHQAAYVRQRLEAPPATGGWIGRLFR
ncbi:MAG TPA: hypothetical protein VGT40_26650 [Methylomirabilota bacterium]|jgi:hypothetical protein|nr:hypothetical protein [Methylomirabilota bacterium]